MLSIPQTIHHVCEQKTIRPLLAIESGSRAWGFASPDSDYDVRLVYCHSPEWYLTVYQGKDSFEFIDNQAFVVPFDIGGWELKKALQLFAKSNAVIFEWLNSPIVYASDGDFVNALKSLQSQFLNPKAIFYHYQGMAKNAYKAMDLEASVSSKKYCYLLRALLASVWIKAMNRPVPVVMMQMAQLLSDKECCAINELIATKQQTHEKDTITLNPTLKQLIGRLWTLSESLPFADFHQGDGRLLDELCQQTILHHANH